MSKNAPLFEALLAFSKEKTRRFHLPGHKGRPQNSVFDDIFAIDYTEIDKTGNLYSQGGIIQAAEAEAARYYGMDNCFFLTCGATQGIKAALLAFCGSDANVVIDRNCHQSAMDACAMLNLNPFYIYPQTLKGSNLSGDIDPAALTDLVSQSKAKAVLVTSPTYYGFNLDIKALSEAAHKGGALLIVDSAHGSHLRACGVLDAAAAGADCVIFSAHKTLFAMGQGAFLLTKRSTPDFAANVRRATALFGTTSPSYPIMASLDYARAELENNPSAYKNCRAMCLDAKAQIEASTPFRVVSPAPGFDPCRLVIEAASAGISGYALSEKLTQAGFDAEMADESHVVLIVTPADDTLTDLVGQLAAFPPAEAGDDAQTLPPLPVPRRAMSPREAYFSEKTEVLLKDSRGKIAASNISPYPPGVPVVTYGEVVDDFSIDYLLKKGYNENSKILVIK